MLFILIWAQSVDSVCDWNNLIFRPGLFIFNFKIQNVSQEKKNGNNSILGLWGKNGLKIWYSIKNKISEKYTTPYIISYVGKYQFGEKLCLQEILKNLLVYFGVSFTRGHGLRFYTFEINVSTLIRHHHCQTFIFIPNYENIPSDDSVWHSFYITHRFIRCYKELIPCRGTCPSKMKVQVPCRVRRSWYVSRPVSYCPLIIRNLALDNGERCHATQACEVVRSSSSC